MIDSANKQAPRTVAVEKNTWILELPDELCAKEGFAPGTLASLTIKDGKILGSFITLTREGDDAAKDFIARYGEFMTMIEDVDR